MTISIKEAKQIVENALNERECRFTKITAKTIHFTDLARASCIFVKVHGGQFNGKWDEIKLIARRSGFCIE